VELAARAALDKATMGLAPEAGLHKATRGPALGASLDRVREAQLPGANPWVARAYMSRGQIRGSHQAQRELRPTTRAMPAPNASEWMTRHRRTAGLHKWRGPFPRP
jgi:hypothetical protein